MNLARPMVVVDRRTYRIARRKITALMDRGDYEVRTGSKRHRIRYAAELEQLELVEAEVNERLGLACKE